MSRVLISCGGTGGHLSPGIALAEELLTRGHQPTLLISRKRVDARLVEKYPQFDFVRIPGSGLGWSPGVLARFIASQARGFVQSWRLVRALRPSVVVGFGGFTSAAFIAAGALQGVPVALHEANRVPGRAVRLLGRFARRVYLPSGVTLSSARTGAVWPMGLPVRAEFRRKDPADARRELGLHPQPPVVVVFGGSQGATPLNDWARREMPRLAADGVQLYCVTGMGKGTDEVHDLLTRERSPVRAIFTPFCDRVATLLSAADLVVSRAGAGTLAELARTQAPAILIPFPQAADNHQWANARAFAEAGAGVVVDQKDLGGVYELVLKTLSDSASLERQREALRRLDSANAVGTLADDLESLMTGGARGRSASEARSGLA